MVASDSNGADPRPGPSGLATKANDDAVVHVSGTETIAGTKTFSSSPNVPAPSSAADIATKGYVDEAVTTVGAGSFVDYAWWIPPRQGILSC